MTVRAASAYFRRRERALMTSTGTVVRDDGEPVYDPVTGDFSQPVTTVYEGDMLVRMAAWEGSDVAAGQTEIRTRPWRLKLPHDAVQLRKDDRVTIGVSDNPGLIGRTFRVTDWFGDDWAPSAPYFAEEVT